MAWKKYRLEVDSFVALLLLTGLIGPVTLEKSLCPEHVGKVLKRIGGCDVTQCETGLTQSQCPPGSVLEEDVALCGCCPGCVKSLQNCSVITQPQYEPECDDLICAIHRPCKLGFECRKDPGEPELTCQAKPTEDCKNTCFIKKALIEEENEEFSPTVERDLPICTKDGKFAPKQCKAGRNDGDCFCVDDCGKRLFGRQLQYKAQNMTCGCTRRVHELRTKKNRMATLHCKENGDFEPLQCDTDSGLCYCVDEITGKTTGEVLPEGQFKLLPCYNASAEEYANNGQYLRVCESQWVASQKISKEAALHGLTYNAPPLECDYDGGYAPKYWDTSLGQESCVHRSGQVLNYFRQYTELTPMDCQCARDHIYFPRQGIPFTIECQRGDSELPNGPATGSYKLYYIDGPIAYCVDTDGHQYGPDAPKELICCLDESCSAEVEKECTEHKPPLKPCLSYEMGRR